MIRAIKRKLQTVKTYLYPLYWQLARFGWRLLPLKKASEIRNHQYTIGITTYLDRYETLFKPFLLQLLKIFPETEIVVTVNGHYNRDSQLLYLEHIRSFLKQFPNVKVITFVEAQGLSKLWNLIIVNSSNERFLILNDDLEISPLFRKDLEQSGILSERIALLNQSWSHFMISREIVNLVGWFDERFPAIGNEDEDYESRLVLKQVDLSFFHFRSIKAILTIPVTYSYGEQVDIINTKYLKANKVFFDTKWDTVAQPTEGYHYVRILNAWVKLKEGMDTPRFYS
ncbi:glycosyltransferase family 2 protein [Pedobacter immunditicola]|uniref:glycosyltransferase family 2 protein n=1 Tax=Pedobacter immunditicola TaxID=3133440 RepID=UPI0030AE14B7